MDKLLHMQGWFPHIPGWAAVEDTKVFTRKRIRDVFWRFGPEITKFRIYG